MEKKQKNCTLCGGRAVLVYEKMRGYVQDSFFDVYECGTCDATFVDPLRSDAWLYEYIYKNAQKIPGYERYYRYSKLVKKTKAPLSLLSNAENVYWSIRESLQKLFSEKKDVKILEVGSGLGYLTYSLNIDGYQAVGLDVSEEAVRKAREEYGEYYIAGDLFDLAVKEKGKYDCVIMAELIEHVVNPKDFVQAALSLINENGFLIITTPNKTTAPKPVVWQSDFPPVHLWFFSEQTISMLAASLKIACIFVDFSSFNNKFYSPVFSGTIEEIQAGLPRLTKTGELFHKQQVSVLKSKIFGLRGRYLLSYAARRLKKKIVSSKSSVLCAILSKTPN
jgi:SAM-dependent methyltransferase